MNNIKKIQEKLIEKNLDAVLVTDEKQPALRHRLPCSPTAP